MGSNSKYLLLVFKVVAKTNIPNSNYWWPCNSPVPPIVRFMTKQNFIWSKALMPLLIWNCVCLINRRIISVKIQEITFRTEFPGSNFLLPTFLTGTNEIFRRQICYFLLILLNSGKFFNLRLDHHWQGRQNESRRVASPSPFKSIYGKWYGTLPKIWFLPFMVEQY